MIDLELLRNNADKIAAAYVEFKRTVNGFDIMNFDINKIADATQIVTKLVTEISREP